MDDLLILDVGCGTHPKGDVNLDLYPKITNQRKNNSIIPKIAYFVNADAHKIPFRSNTFNIVYASHVIEHLINPFIAIQEIKRVSNHIVYLRLPNTPTLFHQSSVHIFGWDKCTLHNFLSMHFRKVNVFSMTNNVLPLRSLGRLRFLRRFLQWLMRKCIHTELTAICIK